MAFKSIIGATCTCLVVFSYNANAALISRLGGLAYYDTVTDLTWLSDANYAQTSGFDADGRMSWIDANNWAANLNISGITDWRLPRVNPDSDSDYTQTELSDFAYNVLGQVDGTPISLAHNENYNLFSNILSDSHLNSYWIDEEFTIYDEPYAYIYEFIYGCSGCYNKQIYDGIAWAVHDGDIGTVPVPAAVWLFGSGLLGLIGITRRKKVA